MVAHVHLVSNLKDFFSTDFNQLYVTGSPSDQIFKIFANPLVPFLSVFLYLILSKWFFNLLRTSFNIQPKGAFMQFVTIGHSGILAIYSGWTFWNSMRIVVPYVLQNGFYNSICDASGELWHVKNLGFWVTHFYLSKYYEFIDTW